ncbi:MAG: hypothetical protein HGA36_02355 [Candidatus Moranbacteria bacterium]|nr:hypothetical protein [Candidatus Moranbacteria bacterium]
MLDGNPWVGAAMSGHYNYKEAAPMFIFAVVIVCVLLVIGVVVFLKERK